MLVVQSNAEHISWTHAFGILGKKYLSDFLKALEKERTSSPRNIIVSATSQISFESLAKPRIYVDDAERIPTEA